MAGLCDSLSEIRSKPHKTTVSCTHITVVHVTLHALDTINAHTHSIRREIRHKPVRLRTCLSLVLQNPHTSECSYAQAVDNQHCESTSNRHKHSESRTHTTPNGRSHTLVRYITQAHAQTCTAQTYYNSKRQRQQNESINNKACDIQSKITLKTAKVEAKKEVSEEGEDGDED